MEPTTRMTARQLVANSTVDMAMRLTAQMFGLSPATVTEIVAVGLPLIARTAAVNPELRRRLYAASLAGMPESPDDLYVRMVERAEVRQSVMDDYRATYGGMLDAVCRAAGRQAGTTDGQAREVMAAVLPAISQVLAAANVGGSEAGFAQRLQDLGS